MLLLISHLSRDSYCYEFKNQFCVIECTFCQMKIKRFVLLKCFGQLWFFFLVEYMEVSFNVLLFNNTSYKRGSTGIWQRAYMILLMLLFHKMVLIEPIDTFWVVALQGPSIWGELGLGLLDLSALSLVDGSETYSWARNVLNGLCQRSRSICLKIFQNRVQIHLWFSGLSVCSTWATEPMVYQSIFTM